MSLTKTSDLIETTRNRVQGTHRGVRNQLSADTAPGATTLDFSHSAETITPGAIVEIDLEAFYVWDVSTGGSSVTVSPGANGTTPAAHLAGAMAYVNPEVSAMSIFDELNVDILALSSPNNGLYGAQTIDLTFDPAQQGYDLVGIVRFLDILEVKYETFDPSLRWPKIAKPMWHPQRNAELTDFPSGNALILQSWPAYLAAGATLRVTCKTGFAPLAALTDVVTTVSGLGASMTDIPTLGAAARLLSAREAQRNLMGARSDSQRADEVQAGANVGAARQFLALRRDRIQEEAASLARVYPAGGGR